MKPPVIAAINNKGGAGKSKTTEHLGFCLAGMGHCVTLFDGDGQANLSTNLGIDTKIDQDGRLSDMLEGRHPRPLRLDDWPKSLFLVASDERLDETASEMAIHPLRISRLSTALAEWDPDDIVIIDTPPNIGALVYAAMLAADYVVIPATPMPESVAGAKRTLEKLDEVRRETGRAPKVLGIVATQVEAHTIAHQEGLEALEGLGVPLLGCVPHRVGRDAHTQLRAAYWPIAQRVLGAIGRGGGA